MVTDNVNNVYILDSLLHILNKISVADNERWIYTPLANNTNIWNLRTQYTTTDGEKTYFLAKEDGRPLEIENTFVSTIKSIAIDTTDDVYVVGTSTPHNGLQELFQGILVLLGLSNEISETNIFKVVDTPVPHLHLWSKDVWNNKGY